jgi:hypothetical protein
MQTSDSAGTSRRGAARGRRLRGGLVAAVTGALVAAGVTAGASAAQALPPKPNFQLPFPCGQTWALFSYDGHNPDDKKIDMQRVGGTTGGSAVVASLGGRVHDLGDPGGIEIDHGGGWFSLYLHMPTRTVSVGQRVEQGQQIGTVGRVGTGVDHLHYELRYDANGNGDSTNSEIVYASFNGVEYNMGANGQSSYSVTSRNCGGGQPQPAAAGVVEAVDYTGDGRTDLAAQYSNGDLRVFDSTGDLSADGRLFGGGALVGTGWGSGGVPRIVRGDFNGDGRTDIAAQYTNGDLRAWASTGDLSADTRLFTGNGVLVGTGWNAPGVERILTADFTGDGRTDIAAQYANGDLRVFNSTGDLSADGRLFGGGALVGTGWGTAGVPRIVTGDFNGDKKADIAAQYTNGDLRAWASTGDLSADARLFTGNGALIGTGWNAPGVERIVPADFTGDGRTDVAAQYSNGNLRVFNSTGDLSADSRLFGPGALVGTGWGGSGVPRIVTGDFNGDKKADIAAQYTNGDVRAWASTGDLSADLRLFSGGVLVGTGWNAPGVERIL